MRERGGGGGEGDGKERKRKREREQDPERFRKSREELTKCILQRNFSEVFGFH